MKRTERQKYIDHSSQLPAGRKAPRDSKNYNRGQFIGNYQDHPHIQIPRNYKVKNTTAAAKLVKAIADQEQEFVVVISLKLNLQAIAARVICIGGRSKADFCPADVFKGAILDGAAEIVLAHNHPGGDLHPTRGDRKTLKSLIKAGKLLDINIIDSVIVHGKYWRSMMVGKRGRKCRK